MKDLLRLGRKTLQRPNDSGTPTGVGTLDWRGRTFRYYVPWIRDHVHTLKGMKYFDGAGASPSTSSASPSARTGWSGTSSPAGASRASTTPPTAPSATRVARRGRVRAHAGRGRRRVPLRGGRLLRLEDRPPTTPGWRRQLDAAVRAMDYSFTDRARFSTKYGLVKRGYTIDTWDFQVDDEWTRIFPRWGTLLVDPDRSKFGVMFGDNTGYAASCGYLAEMLERAGRPRRRRAASASGRRTSARASTAWPGPAPTSATGSPEDETIVRDLGVDERAQVSLSNTYSLNRGISPRAGGGDPPHVPGDPRLASRPARPGEWYAIYPPFAKGFGEHSETWQYVNGGVSPIFAGELARGAFAHGFEAYGADILSRVLDLARRTATSLVRVHRGLPADAGAGFTPVDLSRTRTWTSAGRGARRARAGWRPMPDDHMANLPTGRADLRRHPVPRRRSRQNGRRGAIAVSRRPGFPERVEVPLGRKAGSIYVLHTSATTATRSSRDRSPSSTRTARTRRSTPCAGRERRRLVVPVARGLLAARVRPAAPAPAREARLEGRTTSARRSASSGTASTTRTRTSDAAVAFSSTLDRAIYAVAGPDRLRPAAPPEAARGVVRRAGQLGGGRGRLRPRRGPGRRRGRGRRLPRRRRLAAVARGRDERGPGVVHYPASDGYVAYDYRHDPAKREIALTVTGSGERPSATCCCPRASPPPRR